MKQNKEVAGLKGTLETKLVKVNGDIQIQRKDNIILNDGFDFICDSLGGTSRPPIMGYIAVGTSTTATTATQTGLLSEIGRLKSSYSHTSGTKVFYLESTFAAGAATGAITEAGVVNASSGGAFLDRVVFPVVNKEANDVLTLTFSFTLSSDS